MSSITDNTRPAVSTDGADGANALGIVLFGHGSKDPLWHKPIQAVADTISHHSRNSGAMSAPPVVCAYLELSTPDLASACDDLMQRGVRHIRIVPMFLGVGRHAREDLPLLVRALQTQYPSHIFELCPTVGEDPRLIQLLAQIACETKPTKPTL